MKRFLLALLLLAVPMCAQQQPGRPSGQPGPHPARPDRVGRGGGMMAMIPGGRMEGTWWRNTDLAKKLNLTDQQIQQMEQTYQQSRLKLIDQVAAVQKAEVTLEPMLAADKPDETQVLAQIDKIAQARAELEKSHARMLLGIRQVLTADQWKQLKTEMPRGPMAMGGPGGGGFRTRRRAPDAAPNPQALPPPPQDE